MGCGFNLEVVTPGREEVDIGYHGNHCFLPPGGEEDIKSLVCNNNGLLMIY